MPTDAELAAWNANAKAQLRKALINQSWEQKLEASVRMRERDRELRASRAIGAARALPSLTRKSAPPPRHRR